MSDLSDVIAPIAPKNHNNPPSELEYLSENLTLRHVQFIRTAEEKVSISLKIPDKFTEQNEADYTTSFIKSMQDLIKQAEKNRKEEKEPYLRQGDFVDDFFGGLKKKLSDAILRASAPLDAYLIKQRDEEAARREAEAAAMRKEAQAAIEAAAANKAPEKAPELIEHAITMTQVVKTAEIVAAAPINSMASTTVKGARGSLKTEWNGIIVDVAQLDLHALRPYMTIVDLQKAVDRFVRAGGRKCEGVKITETTGVKVK